MKQINIFYIIFSFILLAFSACSNEDEKITDAGIGILRLGVESNTSVINVDTRAVTPKTKFTITSKADGWSKEYDYSENSKLELKAGSYDIVATIGDNNNGKPGFDIPYYSGKANGVVIKAGEEKTQKISCTLATSKISVNYGDDVKETFAGYDYQTIVSNESGELPFSQSETRSGYFTPGKLSVCFRYRTGGEWIDYPMADVSATARYHYTLKFSVKDTGSEGTTGAANVQLEIVATNDKDAIIDVKLPRTTLKANAFAKFVWLKGEIDSEPSSDVYFDWRQKGDDEWTQDFSATKNMNGIYEALVEGLEPDTEYEYRIAGGNIVDFKTQDIPVIPNLNFDTWTTGPSGKRTKWYPNADLSNSYWATGNEGVLLMGDANTVGVEAEGEGMYAEMSSVKIAIVGFAAGNLYTGTYKTEMTAPIKSARFGRDYTGRPTKLSGYYKYEPKEVNIVSGKDNNTGYMDKCEIYIRLFQDIPGSSDGRFDGATIPDDVIAYGSFSTDETVSDWTYFEIPIVYSDLESIPTKVAIVATSSIEGAFFTGGVGSKLSVDNFELSFEYDERIHGD